MSWLRKGETPMIAAFLATLPTTVAASFSEGRDSAIRPSFVPIVHLGAMMLVVVMGTRKVQLLGLDSRFATISAFVESADLWIEAIDAVETERFIFGLRTDVDHFIFSIAPRAWNVVCDMPIDDWFGHSHEDARSGVVFGWYFESTVVAPNAIIDHFGA